MSQARAILLFVCCGLLLAGCSGEPMTALPGDEAALQIPHPDLTGAEPEVIRAVERERRAVEAAPESTEAWARLGARYRAGNWLAEAAACYAQAERLEPDEFAWPYRRGLALMFSDLEEAVDALARALEIDPYYVPAIVHHAQRLVRLGAYDSARSQFERALELEPGNVHAQVGLGQLALAAGDFEQAKSYLERARAIDPELGAALRTLAQVYLELGDEAEAREAAAAAENLPYLTVMHDPRAEDGSLDPVGSVARIDVGQALLERGHPTQAIEQLQVAIDADPENVLAHYTMGLALIQLERYDEAQAHLETVRRLRPDSPSHLNATAQMRLRQGRYSLAADLWRESVLRDPDDPEVHYALGDVLIRLDRPAEAEQHLRQSLALEPANSDVNFALGALLSDGGRFAEAASYLTESVRLAPENGDAQFYLGTFLARRGKTTDALPHLRAAARARPDDAAIRVNLGLALDRQGASAQAAAEFRHAIRLAPDDVRAYSALAWIYATHREDSLRDAAEAVRLAERAVRVSRGGDPRALDALAAAFAESGRFEEAVEVADRAQSVATGSNRNALAEAIARRSDLYASRRPFRGP
jgi:tetratricopeptide (TPR) repeat protein